MNGEGFAPEKNPGECRGACPHLHREGRVLNKQNFMIANRVSACYSAIANFMWQTSDWK